MGIAVRLDRTFTEADNAHSRLVVIGNHKLAEHYWRDTGFPILARGIPSLL
jgi:hypothetical protein